MPAVYDKMGIRFMYPDNWTLDEQEAVSGNRSVSVSSPGGAFWSIVVYALDTDLDQLAATALEALKTEYDGVESEAVNEQIAGQEVSGYDANFFYLDLTNTALIRGVRVPGANCLVLCQAEDRELQQIDGVFRAITTSLLQRPAA